MEIFSSESKGKYSQSRLNRHPREMEKVTVYPMGFDHPRI